MKERGIVLSVLWSLLWIINDKNLALVQAKGSVPSAAAAPASWFGGGSRPSTSHCVQEDGSSPKRQKKVRKVKNKRRYTDGASGEDVNVDKCELAGDDDEASSDLTKGTRAPDEEVPDKDTDNSMHRKKRKVKVKRWRRPAKVLVEEPAESCEEESEQRHGQAEPMDSEQVYETLEQSPAQEGEAPSKDGLFRKRRRRKVKRKQQPVTVEGATTSVSMSSNEKAPQDHVIAEAEDTGDEGSPENNSGVTAVASSEAVEAKLDSLNEAGANNNKESAGSEVPPLNSIAEAAGANLQASAANWPDEDDKETAGSEVLPLNSIAEAEDSNTEASAAHEPIADNKDSMTSIEVTVDMGIGDLETGVVEAASQVVDEKAEPSRDESMVENAPDESMHEVFEREVARVDDDYVPNLAEFDASASEGDEDEAQTNVTSVLMPPIDATVQNDEEVPAPRRLENDDYGTRVPGDGDKTEDSGRGGAEAGDEIEDDAGSGQKNLDANATDTTDASDLSTGSLSATNKENTQTEARRNALVTECLSSDAERSPDHGTATSRTANVIADNSEKAESVDVRDITDGEGTLNGTATVKVVDQENMLDTTQGELKTEEVTPAVHQKSLGASAVREVVELNNIESDQDDDSDLTVSVVTWNLAEESPSEEDARFIRAFRESPTIGVAGSKSYRIGSDIVLLSGQECENTKPRRAEGHRSREYRRLMIKMLGRKYVPLAIHSLGGVQFGLFCKRSILGEVESVSVADVACGIGNVFHNKGAIAAFVQMKARERKSKCTDSESEHDAKESPSRAKSIRMLFVTAHMAAHVKNTEARNMDYWRIASELEDQAPARFLPPRPERSFRPEGGENTASGSGSHLMDSVDRVFFCGDLNYRVDLPREITESTVMQMLASDTETKTGADDDSCTEVEALRERLLLNDQLLQTMADGSAFPGFVEGKITFPPTFKFDKETKEYDTSHKQRIPAWTDRVLFKPFGVRVLEYTSVQDAMHSDHRPVFAQFRVSMEGRQLGGDRKEGRRRRSKRDKERVD